MTDKTDDLRAIFLRALRTPVPLTRYRPNPPRRAVAGDVMLLSLGDGPDDFREVIVVGPSPPERVFGLAADVFGAGATYRVALEVETAAPIEAALRAAGWRLDEEEPAMVLSPLPAAVPQAPPGLDIRLATDEAALADFRAVSGTSPTWVPSV